MAIGYGIFSGGLDSLLSARVLADQGVEVRLLTFVTPFFGAEKALISGQALGLAPKIIDITPDHLQMLPHPKHGFGRFMNPCIDCHALMFRRAGEIMQQEGGDFLFSGEVLGQRPKSQNPRALTIVARESGFGDYILRPLSAVLLPPTRIELHGLVDRSKLLDLSGRSRKRQMALAEKFGLSEYPTPAGGCLLTDPIFSRRLAELLAHSPRLEAREVELLKWGRHFRLPHGHKLVVGRNQPENDILEQLSQPGDLVLKAADFPGPSVVFSPAGQDGQGLRPDLDLAASITLSYSDAPEGCTALVQLIGSEVERMTETESRPKQAFVQWMV
ncbi:MAG: tRNA 4-thiouridine(8) synthase ThiI [Pseudomonadota bacterium]